MSPKAPTRVARKQRRAPVALLEYVPPPPLTMAARALIGLALLGGFLYVLRLWLIPIKSPDLWFHMRVGEWVFANHRLPPGDIFSSCYQGHEWIVNAWLSEVILWGTFRLGGVTGVLLFQIAISLCVFVTIGLISFKLSARPTLTILTVFLAIVPSYFRFNLRPELFTMVLMVAMLAILYQYKFRQSDRLFWLIPIGALWPNLHMGFTAAPMLLGSFVIGDGLVAWYYASKRKPVPEGIIAGPRLTKLAWISAAMMVATVANPYGFAAWGFVTKLQGQFQSIREWQPLLKVAGDMEFIPFWCLVALAAITFGSLALSRRPQDLVGFLMAGLFAAGAMEFMRQSGQFCMVAPIVTAAAMHRLALPDRLKIRHKARVLLGAGGLLVLEGTLLFCVLVLGLPRQVADSPFGFGTHKTDCSPKALQFLTDNHLVGCKLYNSLETGGWLLWNFWPKQTVYIDGRVDMFGVDALYHYIGIATDPKVGERLKAMGFDYCYLRYPQGVESIQSKYHANSLIHHPDWALVYFDEAALIFVRREPRFAKLIERYEYKVLNPLAPSSLQNDNLPAQADQVLKEATRVRETVTDSGKALLTAGIALQLIGKNTDAVEVIDRARHNALMWGPGYTATSEDFTGRAYLGMADYSRAARHLRKAADLVNTNPNWKEREAFIRNNLGFALFMAKRYGEAEVELKQAVEMHPDLNIARINLGRIRLAQKRYEEAGKLFEEALEGGPSDELTARLFFAESLTLRGNKDEALAQLEIASQMNPRFVASGIKEEELAFESLRGNPRYRALLGR